MHLAVQFVGEIVLLQEFSWHLHSFEDFKLFYLSEKHDFEDIFKQAFSL